MQVAPTFGDAPGVTNSKLAHVQMRSPTGKRPTFHPQPALPADPEWPEVTTVFCGPAQYKVTTLSVCVCVCICVTEHSTLNTAACLLILQCSYSTMQLVGSFCNSLYSTMQLVGSFCNSAYSTLQLVCSCCLQLRLLTGSKHVCDESTACLCMWLAAARRPACSVLGHI